MKSTTQPDWARLRIVILDQDDNFRFWVRSCLRKKRVAEVFSTAKPGDAFDDLCRTEAHIALVELSLNSAKGIDFLKQLRNTSISPNPDLPVLILVNTGEETAAAKAAAFGIEGIINKPVTEADLLAKVARTVLKPRHGIQTYTQAPAAAPPPKPKAQPAPPPPPPPAPKPKIVELKHREVKAPVHTDIKGKIRDFDTPAPPAPEEKDQTIEVKEEQPPPPKTRKKKNSAKAWAEEVAKAGKKRPRRNTPAVNVDQMLKDHILWLKTHGVQGVRASLEGADLSAVYLEGANLANANLLGADLSDANLTGANLTGADLRRAVLEGATLHDANLGVAKLRHVRFDMAQMQEVNLRGADLSGASFKNADLDGADLASAIMLETDIMDVDLSDTNGLTQRQCDQARANMGTKLPVGLRRKLIEVG